MGKLSVFWVCALLLVSCSKTNGADDFGSDKYYELSYVNSGMSGQIVGREDLDFRESIEFFPDSTFSKQRIYADSSSTASGHYGQHVSNGYDYLKLNYDHDTYLIQNCGTSLVEYLRIINETEIFNDGYMPCDGPGYYYIRTKK